MDAVTQSLVYCFELISLRVIRTLNRDYYGVQSFLMVRISGRCLDEALSSFRVLGSKVKLVSYLILIF